MPTASDMYFGNTKLVVEKELISSVSQLTLSFCRPDTSLASKRGLDSKLCRHTLQKEQIFKAHIRSNTEYACLSWMTVSSDVLNQLDAVQQKAL